MRAFIYAVLIVFVLFTINDSQALVPDAVLNQKNAVVTVYVSDQSTGNSVTGSGFIIDNGMVVTNYELVSSYINKNGSSIMVKTYTQGYYVVEKVLAFDADSDLAILKITASELPVTSLAAKYQPEQREPVVVIGRPTGSETALTEGSIQNILGKKKLFEITADVLPGDVGSPVFNVKGEVIGVATIVLISGETLNFAVPVSLVEDLINKTTKKSASEGSAQKHQTAKADKSAPVQSEVNAAQPKRTMPSDWSFFSMSADQDAALLYSPRSIRTVENNMQVLIKWTYLRVRTCVFQFAKNSQTFTWERR